MIGTLTPKYSWMSRFRRSRNTIDPFKLDEFEEYGRRWMPLVTRPAATSHASLSADEREKAGSSDRLIRLSVGIESPADLIADLEQALRGGSPA